MTTINTLEEAENFIYNYDLFKSKAENQIELYDILRKCENISINYGQLKLLCKTRIFLTNYYIQVNDLENALHVGLDNMHLSENDGLENERTTCYSILINLYHLLGDYASAEELIQKMHDILLDNKNYDKLCGFNIIMAIQYYNLKDFQNCITSNETAIRYAENANNINLLVYAYSNFGFQLLHHDLSISQHAIEKALELIKSNKNKLPKYSVAIVELNAARLFLKKKEYDLSSRFIQASIRKLQQININELNFAKLVLAELFTAKRKYKNALVLLTEIEKASIEHRNKADLQSCYQALIILFEKRKKYKDALDYYKKLQQLNEEIYNEESNKRIRHLQILNEVNDIKRQRDHAESMANLKHDFLANMSHEIRTPVNSILGICYLLQQDTLNEKQFDYIQLLQRSGENLLGLINDILDISKIESGKIELVPVTFKLPDVVKDVHDLLQYKASEKKLSFEYHIVDELQKPLKGDAHRLSQVILNIVSNALKFTDTGGVFIEAGILDSQDKQTFVQLKITDTGIGISEDKLQKIFERYEQATATIKTQYGGTGLGLSISKKIVELMNGSLSVSSSINKGTIFTIEIPFENTIETITPKHIPEVDKSFLSGKCILIADDVDTNRLLFKEILLSFNDRIEIYEASNGLEVLERIRKHPVDLVLMDLEMPEQNGIETIQKLRKELNSDYIKVIAHTASLLTLSTEEIKAIGFNDVLLKPFKPSDLLLKLECLKTRRV